MTLDVERARRVAADLARRVGLDEPALAEGVVRVANANMERAIRVVSVQRGLDPREFALLAFGGAGGMHACEIAETLDIAHRHRAAARRRALGARHAARRRHQGLRADDPAGRRRDRRTPSSTTLFAPLVERGRARPGARRIPAATGSHVERRLDVRYVGQSYELAVPMAPGFRDEFDRRHARTYGYAESAPARSRW